MSAPNAAASVRNAQADQLARVADAHRVAQRSEEALDAISAAARLAPDDAAIAAANARMLYETWRPAVEASSRALALDPGNPAATGLFAKTLAAEGDVAGAEEALSRALAVHPQWYAGHHQLMQLRLTAGRRDDFDRTIGAASTAQPGNTALRLAWFQALVAVRDWDGARRVIEPHPGQDDSLALRLARLFLASESDEASRDPHLFDDVAHIQDVGLDIARTRFHLRLGQPDRAATIAQQRVAGPAARAFWPYLSLAWRMLGDPRAHWLDRDETLVRAMDLGFSVEELRRLAVTLRRLLVLAAPFPEQSVRGGIQTDRQLFFHPDDAIVSLRKRALQAVRDYTADLPPLDIDHPLSVAGKRELLVAGSWSVLLRAHGHHAPHTHSHGSLSSAFHIELADEPAGGTDHAGWLAFGDPPPELGLALAATCSVRPIAGSLVLFPSTTWHRTVPFDYGERLSVAFDVTYRGDHHR